MNLADLPIGSTFEPLQHAYSDVNVVVTLAIHSLVIPENLARRYERIRPTEL